MPEGTPAREAQSWAHGQSQARSAGAAHGGQDAGMEEQGQGR